MPSLHTLPYSHVTGMQVLQAMRLQAACTLTVKVYKHDAPAQPVLPGCLHSMMCAGRMSPCAMPHCHGELGSRTGMACERARAVWTAGAAS